MTESPSAGDLAGVLRHAADVLNRRAQIAEQIATLEAEDAALGDEIAATWGARVDEMQSMLKGYVDRQPKRERPVDPTAASEQAVVVADSGTTASPQ